MNWKELSEQLDRIELMLEAITETRGGRYSVAAMEKQKNAQLLRERRLQLEEQKIALRAKQLEVQIKEITKESEGTDSMSDDRILEMLGAK